MRIENPFPLATGASTARPMSREKPPAPAVVSTGCSGFMSCLSRHRRGPQQRAVPRGAAVLPRRSDAGGGDAGAETAEGCWKRVQLLEEEEEGKRLSGHEERPAPGAPERVARGRAKQDRAERGGEVTDRVGNGAKATAEGGGSVMSMGTAKTTAATMCASAGHGVQEVVRLEDGSYMREVRRVVGRPWERLAVQVSRPVVPADAASASEVCFG